VIEASSGSWLLSLAQERIAAAWPDAKRRAEEFRRQYPGASNDDLANVLIGDAAFWAAVVGVGVGSLETIPVVGQYVAVGSVLPEVAYLTKLQFDTALGVDAIYEHNMPDDMLVPVLLASLVYALGLDAIKEVAKQAGQRVSRRLIERVFQETALETAKKLASTVGLRFTKQGLLRAIPLDSIPINAGLNHAGLQAFGRAAKHYFSPHWTMCGGCGHVQPVKSRFCAKCGVGLGAASGQQAPA